jgi:hypothetical protein
VTETGPLVAPSGTVAEISVSPWRAKVAVPLKLTAVAPVKPTPVRVTFISHASISLDLGREEPLLFNFDRKGHGSRPSVAKRIAAFDNGARTHAARDGLVRSQ